MTVCALLPQLIGPLAQRPRIDAELLEIREVPDRDLASVDHAANALPVTDANR